MKLFGNVTYLGKILILFFISKEFSHADISNYNIMNIVNIRIQHVHCHVMSPEND